MIDAKLLNLKHSVLSTASLTSLKPSRRFHIDILICTSMCKQSSHLMLLHHSSSWGTAVKGHRSHGHFENTIPLPQGRIWPLEEPSVGKALGGTELISDIKQKLENLGAELHLSHFLGLSDPTARLALPKTPQRYEVQLFNTIVCFSGQTSVLWAYDFIITLFM